MSVSTQVSQEHGLVVRVAMQLSANTSSSLLTDSQPSLLLTTLLVTQLYSLELTSLREIIPQMLLMVEQQLTLLQLTLRPRSLQHGPMACLHSVRLLFQFYGKKAQLQKQLISLVTMKQIEAFQLPKMLDLPLGQGAFRAHLLVAANLKSLLRDSHPF